MTDIITLITTVTGNLGDSGILRGPNELEVMMNEAYSRGTMVKSHKHFLCLVKPVCWVITVNRVQITYDVPIYSKSAVDQSVEAMNKYLEEGVEFDILRYASLLHMSVHVGNMFLRRGERAPLDKLFKTLLNPHLVSVILPVYNDTKYLTDCIKSILEGESECRYEIIVVDDGSEEDVASIVNSLQTDDDSREERIRYIRTEHVGLIGALELGVKNASSEFIARIDADDISLPNRLSRQLHFLIENPNIHVLGSQAMLIPENVSGGNELSLDLDIAAVPTHPVLVAYSMLFGCSLLHPTAMFRKQSILSCGSYGKAAGTFTECIEDYSLWTRLLRRYSVMFSVRRIQYSDYFLVIHSVSQIYRMSP